jgi:DNA-binding cell septation regulator SpoVG
MKITIEHINGERPQFNVALSSAEGREAFITIKGCRVVDGSKGPFISWPATKNQKTDKYWQHVWASESFAAAVLAEAMKAAPKKAVGNKAYGDDDIPF